MSAFVIGFEGSLGEGLMTWGPAAVMHGKLTKGACVTGDGLVYNSATGHACTLEEFADRVRVGNATWSGYQPIQIESWNGMTVVMIVNRPNTAAFVTSSKREYLGELISTLVGVRDVYTLLIFSDAQFEQYRKDVESAVLGSSKDEDVLRHAAILVPDSARLHAARVNFAPDEKRYLILRSSRAMLAFNQTALIEFDRLVRSPVKDQDPYRPGYGGGGGFD